MHHSMNDSIDVSGAVEKLLQQRSHVMPVCLMPRGVHGAQGTVLDLQGVELDRRAADVDNQYLHRVI
jgi:hypothetical protein